MTQGIPINDGNAVQINEAINATEKGAREFVFLNVVYPVPDKPLLCKQGFGTWHPAKAECASCTIVIACFSKKTSTPVVADYATKRKNKDSTGTPKPARKKREPKAPKKMTTTTQGTDAAAAAPAAQTTPKSLNPFKAGSKPHQIRELLIAIAGTEQDKWTTDQLESLFAEKGLQRLKPRSERPNLINRQLLLYVPSTGRGGKAKNPGENFAPFHGLISAEGAKPNYTFTFNQEALKAKIEELRSSTVQPTEDAEDEDDDE